MPTDRTLWVFAYDIAANSTRTKVQHALEPFGERRQKSVFECRLDARELERVWQRLAALIDPESDSILAWPLTRAGHQRSRAMGLAGVSDWDEPGCEVIGPE